MSDSESVGYSYSAANGAAADQTAGCMFERAWNSSLLNGNTVYSMRDHLAVVPHSVQLK